MAICPSTLPTSGPCSRIAERWCYSAGRFAITPKDATESEHVVPRFTDIGIELRRRWPDTGRIVLLHRTGRVEVGEASVIAVVSAPHREGAFDAARYAIDALKQTAPIWKHEVWADGADWGTGASEVRDARSVSGE